jgi:hypothetical protein
MAVTVVFDPLATEAIRSALADLGAVILNSKPGAIEAYVPRAALAGLAERTDVRSISPILRRTPSYVTSSIDAYGVPAWHAGGLTGTGVKVGIIDGGFQGLPALLGSELPATVHGQCYTDIGQFTDTLGACDSFSPHGTGVAELVIDMAPNVELYIANPISYMDDVRAVQWMTSNGVKIISASYSSGYMFDGPGDGKPGLVRPMG